LKILDSGFRRNNGKPKFQTFYETIMIPAGDIWRTFFAGRAKTMEGLKVQKA
jgi:hypothetical protein